MEKGRNNRIIRFEDEETEIPQNMLQKILKENRKLKEEREINRKNQQKEEEKIKKRKCPSESEIDQFLKEYRNKPMSRKENEEDKTEIRKTENKTKQTKITEFLNNDQRRFPAKNKNNLVNKKENLVKSNEIMKKSSQQ